MKRVFEVCETLIKMLEHYGPPHPGHTCSPLTDCDMSCSEFHDFSMTMQEARNILKQAKDLPDSKPEPCEECTPSPGKAIRIDHYGKCVKCGRLIKPEPDHIVEVNKMVLPTEKTACSDCAELPENQCVDCGRQPVAAEPKSDCEQGYAPGSVCKFCPTKGCRARRYCSKEVPEFEKAVQLEPEPEKNCGNCGVVRSDACARCVDLSMWKPKVAEPKDNCDKCPIPGGRNCSAESCKDYPNKEPQTMEQRFHSEMGKFSELRIRETTDALITLIRAEIERAMEEEKQAVVKYLVKIDNDDCLNMDCDNIGCVECAARKIEQNKHRSEK